MTTSNDKPLRQVGGHWVLRTSLLLVVALAQGCAAPIFSDFQTARVVTKGEWELTPVVAHLPRLGQTNAGLQAARGLGSNVELRARYVRAFTRDLGDTRFVDFDNSDISTASLGLKFSLIDGRLAAHLPVDMIIATESGTVATLHPALIATVPLTAFAEVNSSVNVILPPGLVSVNLGMGIGDLGNWTVRPEVGVMLNTGFVSVGVGVARRFGGSADGSR